MKLLIKNGHIVDPANNLDEIADILLENDKIAQVASRITHPADKTIDARGKMVIPGLIDMHVHLREPGREDKETVASATQAALKGGITTVLAMPNTSPPIDCPENVQLLKKIIQQTARVNVLMAACITQGRRGEGLADIAQVKKQGVLAITDDGASVDNDELLLEALKQAQQSKLLLICHCEDKALSAGGVVNLGLTSTRMGLRGISAESEYKRLTRDIQLAQRAKARIHIAHVSCKESVEIIAQAKKKGIRVTAETAPHYFALCEEDVVGFDTNMKVNPPLRTREDAEAIKRGLVDGTIDAIASDHAPHTENEKDIEFERAAFGAIGLETQLAVSYTELIKPGRLTWPQLISKLAINPAQILGIPGGSLSVGAPADVVIFDLQKLWRVNKEGIVAKSKNSPFIGRRLQGAVAYTIWRGDEVYRYQ